MVVEGPDGVWRRIVLKTALKFVFIRCLGGGYETLRNFPGVNPVQLLNARWKTLGSEKPNR